MLNIHEAFYLLFLSMYIFSIFIYILFFCALYASERDEINE